MKEIAALPPALAIVLRRAGARPLAAAAASGLVGAGVAFLLVFAANAVPQAELPLALVLVVTVFLTAVIFRGIAAAAFVIALTGVPSARDACALFRRNLLLLAVLEVLRAVGAGWVGVGYGLLLEALSQAPLDALARVAAGLVASGAGAWVHARYAAFPSTILLAEGPALLWLKDPEHRDGIAARAEGHLPLLFAAALGAAAYGIITGRLRSDEE
ncbi:MAG: hypothetical protein ACAI25_04540 [Planctomycetota bacterium]